jgi:hypothetical protein
MDLIEYAKGVVARRSEGVIASYRAVSLPGWTPQTNQCHDNVQKWVSATPQHKHVVGYLVCDYPDLGLWSVRSHSLVEFEERHASRHHPATNSLAVPVCSAHRFER